jgi:hypothetical protein
MVCKSSSLGGTIFTACIILFLALSRAGFSQDIEDRPGEKPRSEMSVEEQREADEIRDVLLGKPGAKLPSERMWEANHQMDAEDVRRKYEEDIEKAHGDVAGQVILWRLQGNQQQKAGFRGTLFIKRADGTVYRYRAPINILDRSDPKQNVTDLSSYWSLTSSIPIVQAGAIPPSESLERLFEPNYKSIIRRIEGSPNETFGDVFQASALGDRGLRRKNVSILNALPVNANWSAGNLELKRLGLGGTVQEWRALDQELYQQGAQWKDYQRATKRALLHELATGDTDVLIIFAHASSQRLYLPGIFGGSISSRDLSRIRRTKMPHRIVILLACNTLKSDQSRPPLAEQILRNRLAQTVFAADTQVGAHDIPVILWQLAGGKTPRDSMPMLKQIVRVNPHRFPARDLGGSIEPSN